MLSLVAAGIATVNGKMVAASEGGRRRKLAVGASVRRCVASSNVRESVGRVGLSERNHVRFQMSFET